MRPTRRTSCVVLLIALWGMGSSYAQLIPNLGGQRVGISALQFLKLGVGARAAGLGEAFVSIANDASALYWNPSGIVQFPSHQVLVAHMEYVADIQHDFLGVVYHLDDQNALGASFTSLHMQDMEITTETQPMGTGRYYTFGDVAFGLTYARKMTDQFSAGVTVRYVEETLDVLKIRAVVFDIGTVYWTGLGTARFAVAISNFGSDVSPQGTVPGIDGGTTSAFQSFSVPTVFRLGIAMDPIETDDHRLTTTIQLNHPNDNAENVRVGIEYAWSNTFFLRAGLKSTIGQPLLSADATSDEGMAAGAGLRAAVGSMSVSVDYAYTDFQRLGSVHRISLVLGL
jgi:hypothetical protein